MDSEGFKTAVREFAELHDEMSEASKAVRELRRRKDELGARVLEIMAENDIDEIQLPDGGKLIRRQSKRTEPLRKELIAAHLRGIMQPPDVETAMKTMYDAREVVTKDALSRRKK